MAKKQTDVVTATMIDKARMRLACVVEETPLQCNQGLSELYGARIFLKREDLQPVRSYKLRGAFNCMHQLSDAGKKNGIVCASAGNHAQGVAFSCAYLRMHGMITMPRNTPRQKIDRVKALGGRWVRTQLVGTTYDEACATAYKYSKAHQMPLIHAFDDPMVIAGQGTVGAEIVEQLRMQPDYVLVPVGGGGLLAGVGTYIKAKYPSAKLIGVEAEGAAGMNASLKARKVVSLEKVQTFIDGAAVRTVGKLTFSIAKRLVDGMIVVPEGRVCQEMIELYQRDGIVAEPAGALSIAALDRLSALASRGALKGKIIVCIISGGNNDISRYPEIIERALVWQGLKHYFLITFSQRPGALRQMLDEALGPTDDITLFEYTKKNNRENGPALVGIELRDKKDLAPLTRRMDTIGLPYELLPHDSPVFRFLV